MFVLLIIYFTVIVYNMETSNNFFSWLLKLPLWLRAIVLVLLGALVFIASMSLSACGTPKTVATVQNVNPNSTVTVTMSVSNSTTSSTSTDATPSVNLQNPVNDAKDTH